MLKKYSSPNVFSTATSSSVVPLAAIAALSAAEAAMVGAAAGLGLSMISKKIDDFSRVEASLLAIK